MESGGVVVNVFIQRPDGSARTFPVAGDNDNNRITGGQFTSEVEPNGDGSMRSIIGVRPGERELTLDTTVDGSHEWLVAASADPEFSNVTYTHSNGKLHSHRAKPTGDMSRTDTNATTT